MNKVTLSQIAQKVEQLNPIKLKAHNVVNKVYRGVTQDYELWRVSEEAVNLVKAQLEQLGYVCPVCAEGLTEKSATIDHLLSKRRYLHKALDKKNFLVMCYSCNKNKGAIEFPLWRKRLPKLHQQSLDYALKLLYGEGKLEELLSDSWG